MKERALLQLNGDIRGQVSQNAAFRVKGPLLKRPLDFLLATVGLIIFAPIWLVIALLIKLEDGGPVFYVQERWGKHKKKITVYKFRTMISNADKNGVSIQAGKNDPRITRVGKILRATALDEMPQLFNIWKGEISFVGPRVLPINEIQINEKNGNLPDEAIPGFDLRSKVCPGLTGIAQIYAPRDVTRKNKFRYDGLYIKNMGLLFDIKLILLSFWITLTGKWEIREKKLSFGSRRKHFTKIKIKKSVASKKPIGQILIELEIITEEQLKKALEYQKYG